MPRKSSSDNDETATTDTTNGDDGTTDVRAGSLTTSGGDPKDNPVLPDDVSATADPDDPTTIIDPGADPDLAGS